MDPLALPLSCDCVKGHAQRRYDILARFLKKRLVRPVRVVYTEDLSKAIRGGAKVDLIIGKESMVRFDAAECKIAIRALALLTGKDGLTTLTGLFVVPAGDPARCLADLKGYRIVFGPADSAEKHAAATAALRKAGLPLPGKLETRSSCPEAALAALENERQPGAAAVISSYAMAILEGCGAIDPGSLRVVGRTDPVPFITVFATGSVTAESGGDILEALLAMRGDAALLVAMESKHGFVAPVSRQPDRPAASDSSSSAWPAWRGTRRDAISPWLPEKLPTAAKILWKKRLTGAGLSGIAATEELVIVADRDLEDAHDIFRCLKADTGQQVWMLKYPAEGDMDYGNSPRATPLVYDGKVYLLGALGDLHCVALADGRVVWKKNLIVEFGAKPATWGMCASPLLVQQKLIVNPGAKDASLVALDRLTGKVVWRSPGMPAAYASFIVGSFGGVKQIVGYDAVSLGGWDVGTGKRLWRLVPPERGDFNVPTPINVGGRLLVSSENNGTRLYDFNRQGRIIPEPVAANLDLAPDSSTPVVVDGKVFGVWSELFCLDLNSGLKTLWTGEDDALEDYVSIIGSRGRLLITTVGGELLLVGTGAKRYELISRLRVFGDQSEVLSHPALVGRRLYIRDGSAICCVALDAD